MLRKIAGLVAGTYLYVVEGEIWKVVDQVSQALFVVSSFARSLVMSLFTYNERRNKRRIGPYIARG
jgi:hypothetical protein